MSTEDAYNHENRRVTESVDVKKTVMVLTVSGMHKDIRVQTSGYKEAPGEKVKMLRVVTLESITKG